jgi:hypothetical protein
VTDPLTPSLERAPEELEKSGTRAKLVPFAAWRAHHVSEQTIAPHTKRSTAGR